MSSALATVGSLGERSGGASRVSPNVVDYSRPLNHSSTTCPIGVSSCLRSNGSRTAKADDRCGSVSPVMMMCWQYVAASSSARSTREAHGGAGEFG